MSLTVTPLYGRPASGSLPSGQVAVRPTGPNVVTGDTATGLVGLFAGDGKGVFVPSLSGLTFDPVGKTLAATGGGAVTSVNGQTGAVTITAAGIGAAAASHTHAGVYQPVGNYATGGGTATGTNTGDQSSVSGNAGTATALATARNLNGVTFDGTANVTVPIPLARTAVKTSAYTAAAGDLVPCDTTTAGFSVTLPAAPADKTLVCVKHVVQGGANAVTVACGGSDVFNRTGGGTTATLPLANQALLLEYTAAAGVWTVLADDLPLSALDGRYSPIFSTSADLAAILSDETGTGFVVFSAAPVLTGTVGVRSTADPTRRGTFNHDGTTRFTIGCSYGSVRIAGDGGGQLDIRNDNGKCESTGGWMGPSLEPGGSLYGSIALSLLAAGVVQFGTASRGDTTASVPKTPAQLTATQNDYAPGVARFYRLSTDASRTVTGLSISQVNGQECEVWNVGSNSLVLAHQSASSSAANRFICGGAADLTLAADEIAMLRYDAASSRWRVRKV